MNDKRLTSIKYIFFAAIVFFVGYVCIQFSASAKEDTAPQKLVEFDLESKAELAPTPPMGWNSWHWFGENITEEKIKGIIDAMVSSGMRDVGYEYVCLDDGWQRYKADRSETYPLEADPIKFPSGIKALAGYAHDRGLKFGIYSGPAPRTCAMYTGSYGHEEEDAKQFAHWDVDFLKYDGCNLSRLYPEIDAKAAFRKMANALKNSGRDIVYHVCYGGRENVWEWAAEYAHQWRIGRDLWNEFERAPEDINHWANRVVELIDIGIGKEQYSGPNGWNDFDMLIVGLNDDINQKSVSFETKTGQYLRLEALSEVNDNPWTSMAEINIQGPTSSGCNASLPQTSWSLAYVDSEELIGEDGAANNAFDGDPATFWHTEWYTANPPHPHEIIIDIGSVDDICAFSYLPRQDGQMNGRIRDYEFNVSLGGQNWDAPAVTGTFTYDDGPALGGNGCTEIEYRTHFSMWCILSSPLLAGNDLRNMSAYTLETLTNDEIIALNQDPSGVQASRVVNDGDKYQIFAKELEDGSWGIALLNRSSASHNMTVNWQQDLNVSWTVARVRNLWEHADKGEFTGSYTADVLSHEAVMLRIYPRGTLIKAMPFIPLLLLN